MKWILLSCITLALFTGCTKANAPESGEKPKPTTSAAQTLIGGFTGQTAVKAGKKAEADIKRISEQRDRDLDAVMK